MTLFKFCSNLKSPQIIKVGYVYHVAYNVTIFHWVAAQAVVSINKNEFIVHNHKGCSTSEVIRIH